MTGAAAQRAAIVPVSRGVWRIMRTTLALWARRRRERAELVRLSDWALRDFGISRSEAIGESSKSFWRH